MARVAFLGLGVMGFPMAGHLAAKGHDVVVYNRTFAKAESWTKKHKGTAARTPREAAAGREIVFCCVGNDDDLRSVVLGPDGAFAGMAKGSIFFDNTTASADIARAAARQLPAAHGDTHGVSASSTAQTLAAVCAHRLDRLRPRLT